MGKCGNHRLWLFVFVSLVTPFACVELRTALVVVTESNWFVSSESGSSYGRLWLYFCGVWRFGVDGGLEAWGVFFGRGLRCGRHYCEAFFSVVSFGGFDLCGQGSLYFGHGGCRTF